MYQLGWVGGGGGVSVGRHVFPAVGAGNLQSLFDTGRERPGRRSRPARAPPTGADCSNGDKPFPWLTDLLCRRAAIARHTPYLPGDVQFQGAMTFTVVPAKAVNHRANCQGVSDDWVNLSTGNDRL